MTKPNVSRKSSISRVQAVVYARGTDQLDPYHAVELCAQWAAVHDWTVLAVVRESCDGEPPLERAGIRTVLTHLHARRGTVALAASRDQIAYDAVAFHEVCAEAERTGGFLHVLGDPKEIPDAP
jgi:hypothetical protein